MFFSFISLTSFIKKNTNYNSLTKITRFNSFFNFFSFRMSEKKIKKFSLNKSNHVHKKAKEHFVFHWSSVIFDKTPVFLDLFSYNVFLSNYIIFFFSFFKNLSISWRTFIIKKK